MRIDLAGFGPGSTDLVTGQLKHVLSHAEVIITSGRLAGILREEEQTDSDSADSALYLNPDVRILEETRSARICTLLEELFLSGTCEYVLCLFGGDSSFYSGAAPLLWRIEESDVLQEDSVSVSLIPGISSLSAACARLKIPVREVEIYSAHGRACDPVKAVMNGKMSFFLTGGSTGPADLCRELTKAGLGELEVTVCEMLSTSQERIRVMTAKQAAEENYLPLSVLFVRPAFVSEQLRRSVPGIEDEAFQRGAVPMTKHFVRVCALSMLSPAEDEVCWDLGAGTGSVSVEMSALCRRVFSVERNPEAIHLLEENRKQFGSWNMQIIQGEIGQAAEDLPFPDAIFLGGGGTQLGVVLDIVKKHSCNESEQNHSRSMPRIVAAAITLETLYEVRTVLEEYGYEVQTVQIAVTDVKKRGHYHMMDGQNPVFLISGKAGRETD